MCALISFLLQTATLGNTQDGTAPAELLVEQPRKFEFVINLQTAKQIGLIIPPNVLARKFELVINVKTAKQIGVTIPNIVLARTDRAQAPD
jgi:ABC-type uncharacterized transport system substrate-binding protein